MPDPELKFARIDLRDGGRIGSASWDMTHGQRWRKRAGLGLIVGEAPSSRAMEQGTRPGEPLTHDSRVGARLLRLTGLGLRDYYALYDRANLLPVQPPGGGDHAGDQFDQGLAERAGHELLGHVTKRRYKLVIMLGRRVQRVIGACLGDPRLAGRDQLVMMRSSTMLPWFMACPHPSGASHFWNHQDNVRAAEGVMSAVTRALRAGQYD